MNKKGKFSLYIAGAAIGLVMLFFVAKSLFTSPVSREIPKISDTTNLSKPVQEQISQAFKLAYRKPSAENLGMLGMVYHSSANYAEAAKCYELAIKQSPIDWKWSYYNGYLNTEMGNSGEAIKNFKQVTEKNPGIDLAWYYLGEEYKNLRNNEMAEKSYKEIKTGKDNSINTNQANREDHFALNTYATFELSRLYFDTNRNDLAEETLKELIQRDYLFGPSYKLLGSIYNLKGDTIQGKKFTVRANDFIPFSPPVDSLIDKLVLMSRSELYLLKKIDEAEKSFHSDWALKLVNQGLQYMPDNNYLISKAIKIYLWKRLNDQAIALTDKHMQLFNGNYIEIKNTGMFFFQNGLFEQAAKYWTKALELQPDEILIQEYLAKCFNATGEKQKSLQILDNLTAKNPNNVDIITDVTFLFFQFGDMEKAVENLSKLKQLAPFGAKVIRLEGELAESKSDYQKAIHFYESSFKADPNDVETIKNLGELYQKHEMWGKYIKLYTTANEYHPNNPDFLARLGEVLISCPETSLRNIAKGKEFSERAFTYYNCPPDILIASGSHLAYAYSLLGDQQKAVSTISKTINIARREKIPKSQQARLETMLKAFQNMGIQ